jgi:predicted dehydrogenase
MRAGVVGAGFVGAIHARALAANPDVELVGVCGRTAGRAAALAARLGVPAYVGVAELLRRARPDLVCVATGNQDHAEPTLAALRAGAHVFCEKPLAFDLDEARAMAAAARRRGLALGVNFNHRFSTPFRRALAAVDDGVLGDLAYVDVKFAGDLYKDLNHPHAQLIETQGHSFDLMRRFGGEIAAVHAFLADPRGIGVTTSAAVSVEFASGAVGTLLGSWDSAYDHPAAQLVEASGTGGRVIVENVVDAVRVFRHGEPAYREWRPNLFAADDRDFWRTIDRHVDAFVAAVRDGREPPVTGEDGVRALELTFAAIRSAAERRPVPAA